MLLEPAPLHFEPCKVFQDAFMDAGIPWTQFDVDSVDDESERLLYLGVEFSIKSSIFSTVKYTLFDNTWGNNIQIVENL